MLFIILLHMLILDSDSDNFIIPEKGDSFAAYHIHNHTINIMKVTSQKAQINKPTTQVSKDSTIS